MKVNSINVKVEANYDKRSSLNPKEEPFLGLYDLKITWYLKTEENLKKIKRILNKVEEICPLKGTLTRIHTFHQKIKLIK